MYADKRQQKQLRLTTHYHPLMARLLQSPKLVVPPQTMVIVNALFAKWGPAMFVIAAKGLHCDISPKQKNRVPIGFCKRYKVPAV
ncbi:MAG: hypothetical protein C0594_11805 [Marinilabiliales bacterium]|nr:MAG: hypothetical protein C0594_11805 [Marinilabiliales bacterium]